MSTALSDINTLINDRRRDSGSTTVDMTAEGFRAINSTLDMWQIVHDWPWTVEKQVITYHAGIDTYDLNDDHKEPIDMRYQKAPGRYREFSRVTQNNFDSDTLKTNRFSPIMVTQGKRIRIKCTQGDRIALHTATAYDADGTWTAGGDASNVTTDSYEWFDLTASINFDYDGTSGTLTVDGMSAKDIRKYVSRGKVYMNIYLPTVTNFTSVAIKVGSSDSAYYSDTQTTDYLGDSVATGWNKFGFGIFDSAATGTPDDQNIDYIQLTFTYGSSTTDTDFRIENIFLSEDVPLVYEYYSTYMVQDAGDSTKRDNFDNSASTTDTFLWSGEWDFVKEAFVDSALETIFWLTGEYEDRNVALQKITSIVEPLKRRFPSRRRFPETQMELENDDYPINYRYGQRRYQ